MPTKGNPIVYAETIVDPKASTGLVYAHYDVMPAELLEWWKCEGVEPDIRHGRLLGGGAEGE